MPDTSILSDFEPRFDGDESYVFFMFTAGTGEMMLASSENANETTVRGWVSAINAGHPLSLTLSPHTYFGSQDEDEEIEEIVFSGVIHASFGPRGEEFTVPANVFVDYACRLLSRYSAAEHRIFWMLTEISPHTADVFAEQLTGMDLPGGASSAQRSLRPVMPTLHTKRDQELTDDQVAWLFRDKEKTISLRQLEEFLPMMMKNLKPHLQEAGILPQRSVNTRNMKVTTGELLKKFVPYMKNHQNDPFLHLLGLLRDHEVIPDYEKPPRP